MRSSALESASTAAPLWSAPLRLLRGNVQAFVEAVSLVNTHRTLTHEMARRELGDRYSGQMLGMFWHVVHPMFMMALYLFVFVFVFKTKIASTATKMPLDYTTYLLAGLIPWISVQDALAKASTAVTSNANLVKQVIFPVELLPVKTVLATLYTQLISTGLLLLYVMVVQRTFWATFLLLPVLFVLQVLFCVGLGFLFSTIGAFFRDLKDFVQIFCMAGVYLLPVFYLPDWVPPMFKPVLYLNPFSYLTWCYQDAIYFGRFEHPASWAVFTVLSFLSFIGGYRVMRRLKPVLGNVL